MTRAIKRHNEDERYTWESGAGGSFTAQGDIAQVQGDIGRGTSTICYLKEDNTEFLQEPHRHDQVKRGYSLAVETEHAAPDAGAEGLTTVFAEMQVRLKNASKDRGKQNSQGQMTVPFATEVAEGRPVHREGRLLRCRRRGLLTRSGDATTRCSPRDPIRQSGAR
mmetsp:Transcript_110704/g.352621  ORF Transcript_110704/g.352621 Transcript_110704/m.352621 type:complete len:165 (+) Transcript_110704:526-1020(+)